MLHAERGPHLIYHMLWLGKLVWELSLNGAKLHVVIASESGCGPDDAQARIENYPATDIKVGDGDPGGIRTHGLPFSRRALSRLFRAPLSYRVGSPSPWGGADRQVPAFDPSLPDSRRCRLHSTRGLRPHFVLVLRHTNVRKTPNSRPASRPSTISAR